MKIFQFDWTDRNPLKILCFADFPKLLIASQSSLISISSPVPFTLIGHNLSLLLDCPHASPLHRLLYWTYVLHFHWSGATALSSHFCHCIASMGDDDIWYIQGLKCLLDPWRPNYAGPMACGEIKSCKEIDH